jgi:hypothetical protein
MIEVIQFLTPSGIYLNKFNRFWKTQIKGIWTENAEDSAFYQRKRK